MQETRSTSPTMLLRNRDLVQSFERLNDSHSACRCKESLTLGSVLALVDPPMFSFALPVCPSHMVQKTPASPTDKTILATRVQRCNIYNPKKVTPSPPSSRSFLLALFNKTFMTAQVMIDKAENDIMSIIAFRYLGPSDSGKKNGL